MLIFTLFLTYTLYGQHTSIVTTLEFATEALCDKAKRGVIDAMHQTNAVTGQPFSTDVFGYCIVNQQLPT